MKFILREFLAYRNFILGEIEINFIEKIVIEKMLNRVKNEIVFFFKRNKEFAIEEHFKKEAGDFTLVLFSWKESLLSSHNILSLCVFNIMINEFAFYFI